MFIPEENTGLFPNIVNLPIQINLYLICSETYIVFKNCRDVVLRLILSGFSFYLKTSFLD